MMIIHYRTNQNVQIYKIKKEPPNWEKSFEILNDHFEYYKRSEKTLMSSKVEIYQKLNKNK